MHQQAAAVPYSDLPLPRLILAARRPRSEPRPATDDKRLLQHLYGAGYQPLPLPIKGRQLILSLEREVDPLDLEHLTDAVGWRRRPLRRVRKAIHHSLLVTGLWRHDVRLPKLVGFARCTGDGVINAAVWDVVVHPHYQGVGLGRSLMDFVVQRLRSMGVERITLFADPDVVRFYTNQGWQLEPQDQRCCFWYAR